MASNLTIFSCAASSFRRVYLCEEGKVSRQARRKERRRSRSYIRRDEYAIPIIFPAREPGSPIYIIASNSNLSWTEILVFLFIGITYLLDAMMFKWTSASKLYVTILPACVACSNDFLSINLNDKNYYSNKYNSTKNSLRLY